MALAGIALAWCMYIWRTDLPKIFADNNRRVYNFLLNKWYFDELYSVLFVRTTFWLARLGWRVVDGTIIDGVPNGLAAMATEGSREAVKIQTGSLAAYAFVMLIGVVALIGVYMYVR